MKCILPEGCPVDDCDEYGECYIFRCEHPHAPKPEIAAAQAPSPTGNAALLPQQQPASAAASKDDLLAQFAELLLTVNAARSHT